MAFTTLADRFAQSSQEIYGKFATRQTPDGQPYVSILPDTADSRSRIKNDTRAVPVVSTLRDATRVSKFLKSSDGLLFITKQTLLQTGNTFVNTKLFNPASILLNVVPFVHARRHIVTSAVVPNPSGLLQNNTVSDLSGRISITTTGGTKLPSFGSFISTQLKRAANTIVPLPQNYLESRPEYKTFKYNRADFTGPVILDPQPLSQRGVPRLAATASIKGILLRKAASSLTNLFSNTVKRITGNVIPTPDKLKEPDKIPSFINAAVDFRNKQLRNTKDRLNSKYLGEYKFYTDIAATSVVETSGINPVVNGKNSVVSDPLNAVGFGTNPEENRLSYSGINQAHPRKTDIVKFAFTNSNGDTVQFRAFISQLKESTKTEFTEQRYVGRTERFVTYGGAKRSVTINFNIAAFSQMELMNMWTRINYLTGLAFPAGVSNSGFMTPPLFKITVGGIYDSQPCYVETLDFDMIDDSITFDIDKEVSQAINVSMTISLLEKRSKFYNSPFYKVTEDLSVDQKSYSSNRLGTFTNIGTAQGAVQVGRLFDATVNSTLSLRDSVRLRSLTNTPSISAVRVPQLRLPTISATENIAKSILKTDFNARANNNANEARRAYAEMFCRDSEDKDACILRFLGEV